MKFEWSPSLGPFNGAFVFMSASVPKMDRALRFLDGPLERTLMLRIIDRRVDDAVQSLLAHTLNAGGRIVHGGQPKILTTITHQASHWKVAKGIEPPVRIYQSEYFKEFDSPPGRDRLEMSGIGKIHWVSADLTKVAKDLEISDAWIQNWLARQTGPGAEPEKSRALLAMRLVMLLESQPKAAFCIGGMEGIEAEAELFLELAKSGRLKAPARVNVIASTFGASAKLEGEGIEIVDRTPPAPVQEKHTLMKFLVAPHEADAWGSRASENIPSPSEETSRRDLERRVSYDGILRASLKGIAQAADKMG